MASALWALRQRKERKVAEAEHRGLLEAMSSGLCPGPGESRGGETEHLRAGQGEQGLCGLHIPRAVTVAP